MDLSYFLEKEKPQWANQPCLYIIKQMASNNENVFRCGASGTHLYTDSDLPYGSDDDSKVQGLLARAQMYKNYWLPIEGKIYAALQIKRALVATGSQRVGTNASGSSYNITKGSQTLVLAREDEFHNELDQRGLRWPKAQKNELFKPKRDEKELIAALRTIRGEKMFLFTHDQILEDVAYRGGSRKTRIRITDTSQRVMPSRESKAPSLTVRLTKSALSQLRAGNPNQFAALLKLIKDFDDDIDDDDDT